MTPAASADFLSDLALRNACTRWLSGHRPRRSLGEAMAQLMADTPSADLELGLDTYGEGPLTQRLEAEVAALLGKERAVFFHKGVAAQLAALRVWAGDAREALVALHRQSHIELDESAAYERLMGLRGLRLGEADRHFGVSELAAAGERPDVVTVELPLRRAGYRLPSWSSLESLRDWSRERGIPLHLDGARLWEASAGYGVRPDQLAALGDSVYVSFYKGLGGLGGCVLAGPADFVERTRAWQSRLAGNLWTAFPYVLSAANGLRAYLPRMGEFRDRAASLARALAGVEGLRVAPEPPQVNAFQVHLAGDPGRVMAALRGVAAQERFWIAGRAAATAVDGVSMIEVSIGDAAEDWRDDEVARLLAGVVAALRAEGRAEGEVG